MILFRRLCRLDVRRRLFWILNGIGLLTAFWHVYRHVRVHHVDKDKDDQELRDVLSQRPEGGSRGRRRRG